MRLLFDQNISFRILRLLQENFQDIAQVRTLGIENYTDQQLWEYAKQNDYAIVTFDADFADIAYVKGHPPKIIWLRTGNMTTTKIATPLIGYKHVIETFLTNKDYAEIACLELE